MNHETKPMLVWVDVDLGIADVVARLNEVPGVRTLYSCQGTIGEGGQHPYPARVGVSWNDDETLKLLLSFFDVTLQGNYWGEVHPREGYSYGSDAAFVSHARTDLPDALLELKRVREESEAEIGRLKEEVRLFQSDVERLKKEIDRYTI